MAATLVRLRWRLLGNALTRSTWALVGTGLGALSGLSLLVLLTAGAVALGLAGADLAAPVLAAAGALTVIGWSVIPLLATGVDATVDPRAMAAWVAPSRRLALGLAVAGAAGPAGIGTGAALLLPAVVWAVQGSWGSAALAVLLAPVALATCVLLGRVIVVAAGLSDTRHGRDAVAVVGTALVLLLALAPTLLNAVLLTGTDLDLARWSRGAQILGLTPLGWALAAPGYLARGRVLAAVALAIGAFLVPLVLLPVWERVVRRAMTGPARARGRVRAYEVAGGAGQSSTAPGGAGAPGRGRGGRDGGVVVLPWQRRYASVVPGPAAAVAARCLRYWRTDPRYLVQAATALLLPGLVVVLTAATVTTGAVTGGGPRLGWGSASPAVLAAPAVLAGIAGWVLHDDLAMDSSALWSHISAGLRGRDDRLGRVVAAATWQVPAVVVLGAVCAGWSGRWDALPAVLGACAGLHGASLAWSCVLSVLLPYETNPPGESPMRSRTSGTAFLAALIQMVAPGVIGLIALPPLGGLIAVALGGAWDWGWLVLVGGLAWGLGLLAIGVVLGGRLLDRRAPQVLAVIRSWAGHDDPH